MIILAYDPFTFESRIAIIEGEYIHYVNVSSEIDEAVDNLISIAYENNIFDVQIAGPFRVAEKIKELIKEKDPSNKIIIKELEK